MIGLIIAVILFNLIAFKTNKRLTKNQIVHIWSFTITLQIIADLFIDQKYHGYWYFTQDVDWEGLPSLTILLPPVNMMFLNWFPFNSPLVKRILYYIYWMVFMVIYELIALLPEPWGYFNYGWWKLEYSIFFDPILLVILLNFYKWICKIEKS
ncbi:hypothetical protein [Bacillus salipaludis]|uniref:Uncharacterized protein n=1 Tax=Bacillus salipaludis TaxID=2547811 RepID=A0AA90TWL6_9BACI|nr:hypothetical protein [Bacillus salipaludis]MDQ6600807.1 hypothetical protein [Bacillus salipaludis]